MLMAIPYYEGGNDDILGCRTMSIQAIARKANGGIGANISEFLQKRAVVDLDARDPN
jgi:hypothetical protein